MKKDKNDTLTIAEISKFIPRDTDSVVAARKEVQNGYYINTYFPFYPGIFLFLNEVHATNIKVGTFPKGTEMIVMNYCISGRCEFKTNTDRYKYLTDNNLSIGGYIVRESFFYPTDYYLGFEVGIVEAMFTPETYEVLEGFGIDIEKLRTISRKHNGLLILEANSKLQKLWLEMYGNSGEDTMLIKLKMLEILRILTTSDLGETEKAVYLTRSQTELARTVQRRLTEDISRHVSMRELSLELNVSESSLKKYFKIMFDMNVSEYMRVFRLKRAARLLAETDMSVFDIAAGCGFTNQGRFAKLFKEYYGMRPLEYKHEGSKYRK